jgi:histidine triad (HIT) family protein
VFLGLLKKLLENHRALKKRFIQDMSQAEHLDHSDNCIFCKIVAGKIPSKKVYEDEEIYAFHDINPTAPIHFLIIPKRHFANLMEADSADEALLGRMMTIAPRLALEQGCRPGDTGGFRVMINNGADGGQEVYHLHMHVMGGPRPWNKN